MSIKCLRLFGRRSAAGFLLGVLAQLGMPAAGISAEVSELEQLRRELAEHRKYVESLEKRLQSQEAKAASDPGIEAGYDGGFFVKSKDKPFSMVFNGLGQFRYTLQAPVAGGDTNQTFDVVLARLAISGHVFDPRLTYFTQIQGSTLGNDNNITMLDWWMKWNFRPETGVQAGRFILPYSRQFYTHPGNLMFADLSQADLSFNLPRAIGTNASTKLGPFTLHAAFTNSIRALDAPGQENFGSQMAGLGRIEFDILKPYGYLETSPKLVADPELSVGLAAAYNPIDGTSSLQNLVNGDTTTNVTLDLGYRWQGVSFQSAAYYRRDNFTTPGLGTGNDWGFYTQAGLFVIPERLEIAGNISGVQFDKLNVAGVNKRTTAYTFGVNYYLYGHNLKIQADYSYLDNVSFKSQPKAVDSNRFRLQSQFLF